MLACLVGCARPESSSSALSPFEDLSSALDPDRFDVADRLELLNLLHFYSHLADGLHTDLFGEFFTEDAVMTVVSQGMSPDAKPAVVGAGRAAIVEALRPRHAAFRRDGIQRRHFLTNPIVWNQTRDSARVSVYLQLRTSERGGPSRIEGTGRYVGRARRTEQGWRISEWTIYSDQRLE